GSKAHVAGASWACAGRAAKGAVAGRPRRARPRLRQAVRRRAGSRFMALSGKLGAARTRRFETLSEISKENTSGAVAGEDLGVARLFDDLVAALAAEGHLLRRRRGAG